MNLASKFILIEEMKEDMCAGHDVRVEGSSPSWADIERSIS